MGNWRTVNLTGTVDEAEVEALRTRLIYDYSTPGGFDNFGPLSFSPATPSLAGVGDWVRPTIFACGNLAERDYGVEDVAETLRELVAPAPSLRLKVHCGGDWEDTACVATVTVADGVVTVGPAEVETVASVSDDEAMGRLLRNLHRSAP